MQLFKSITDPFKGIVNALLPREEPKNELSDFIFIYPRIFWMVYPTKEKIQEISDSLNTQFNKNHYFIWNLSEYKYNAKFFRDQVIEFEFPGYPCPPMQYIFMICKSVLEWLRSDKNNVAFLHCHGSGGRSALIIACLLTLLKVVNHPMEALTYFCNKLHLKDSAFLFPTQHLYIRNFANMLDDIKVNRKKVILEKIILNEVPKFRLDERDNYISDQKLLEEESFKPYIQIYQGDSAIYNYLRDHNPMEYSRNEIGIVFHLNIEVTDDILIRCRHFRTDDERLSVFRLMFNPYFAFDRVFRLYARDIDFSPEFDPSSNFFVDIVLKFTDQEYPEAEMLCQLKDECVKLAKDHRQNKPQQTKKPADQGSSLRKASQEGLVGARKESQEDNLVREGQQQQPVHMRIIKAPVDDDLDKASTESLQGSIAPSETEDEESNKGESSSAQPQEEKIDESLNSAALTTQEDSAVKETEMSEQEAKAIADKAADDLDKASTESIQGSNAPSEP